MVSQPYYSFTYNLFYALLLVKQKSITPGVFFHVTYCVPVQLSVNLDFQKDCVLVRFKDYCYIDLMLSTHPLISETLESLTGMEKSENLRLKKTINKLRLNHCGVQMELCYPYFHHCVSTAYSCYSTCQVTLKIRS